MAKQKFSLSANPTFKAPVKIGVPGGDPVDVEFTFKHRSKDAMKQFITEMKGKEDVDLIKDIASGWELDDAFDTESLEKLNQNYPGAALGIWQVYVTELQGARAKN